MLESNEVRMLFKQQRAFSFSNLFLLPNTCLLMFTSLHVGNQNEFIIVFDFGLYILSKYRCSEPEGRMEKLSLQRLE